MEGEFINVRKSLLENLIEVCQVMTEILMTKQLSDKDSSKIEFTNKIIADTVEELEKDIKEIVY